MLLPINAPLEYWDDSVQAALFVAFSLRYLIVLNVSWLITSAHYVWGLDKKHKPSDSNMIFLVTKSYWPQYHYLLPFDYQTGEFGNYGMSKFILARFVILIFHWLRQKSFHSDYFIKLWRKMSEEERVWHGIRACSPKKFSVRFDIELAVHALCNVFFASLRRHSWWCTRFS